MTVQEYIARQTERMAESLAHFVGTMPEDKLDWKPSLENGDPCRSAYDQVGECISVNRVFVKLLRGEEVPATGRMPEPTFASPQNAQEELIASGRELGQALRELPDEALSRTFAHPRGAMRGENMMMMALRNMAYHAGQINFIQTLYGDKEFHVPPNWR